MFIFFKWNYYNTLGPRSYCKSIVEIIKSQRIYIRDFIVIKIDEINLGLKIYMFVEDMNSVKKEVNVLA
jgi:hypothetical protein